MIASELKEKERLFFLLTCLNQYVEKDMLRQNLVCLLALHFF